MSEVRTCYKCQVERPLKMFYVGIENRRAEREGRSQWQMHCRSCQQAINTARRKPRQDHADAVKLAAGCANCHRIRTRSRQAVTFGRVRR